jgi:hypothetical protein
MPIKKAPDGAPAFSLNILRHRGLAPGSIFLSFGKKDGCRIKSGMTARGMRPAFSLNPTRHPGLEPGSIFLPFRRKDGCRIKSGMTAWGMRLLALSLWERVG